MEASFWSKVTVGSEDECWPWQARSRTVKGYGIARGPSGRTTAHRVAWEEENGPIPEGMIVCHHCDNPPCCNPAHLFLGTHASNAQDKVLKGRQRPGEEHHAARLTADDVRAIRAKYAAGGIRQIDLANEYGITIMQVNRIVHRKRWATVA